MTTKLDAIICPFNYISWHYLSTNSYPWLKKKTFFACVLNIRHVGIVIVFFNILITCNLPYLYILYVKYSCEQTCIILTINRNMTLLQLVKNWIILMKQNFILLPLNLVLTCKQICCIPFIHTMPQFIDP